MHDEDDLHEPEHDHLLDHEFLYDDVEHEADAQGAEDEVEEERPRGRARRANDMVEMASEPTAPPAPRWLLRSRGHRQ